MTIKIIACISSNSGLGMNDGSLLFHIKEDLQKFKNITSEEKGSILLFGRKTFDSIISLRGKPLPDRLSVVLTRDANYKSKYGEQVYTDLTRLINHSKTLTDKDKTIFICGGGELYSQLLEFSDEILLTIVNKHVEADVYYPMELQESLNFVEVETSEDFYSEKYNAYYKFVRYVKDNNLEEGEMEVD